MSEGSNDKLQGMPRTFEYLLNALEDAAQSNNPHGAGYAEKRRAVFEHVEDLWDDYMRLLREKQDKLDQSANTPSEAAVARGAIVIAQSPLIDKPKLPPVCWEGLARAVLEAALNSHPYVLEKGK